MPTTTSTCRSSWSCRWASTSFTDAHPLRLSKCFTICKKVLHDKKLSTNVGDEGGFAPDLKSNQEALDVIVEAIGKAGYKLGRAGLHRPGRGRHRVLRRREARPTPSTARRSTSAGMVDLLAGWVEKYPICSIEDGCAEDDWEGWKMLTDRLGKQDPARRRRPVRHQHQAPAARHRRRHRQQHPDQGQPDRHADRDDRSHRTGPSQRLHSDLQPPQRRDRGFDDRRPGRGPAHRPDQDRLAPRAPTAWPSTTSCCGSRRSSATRPSTAARCSSGSSPITA